MDALAATRSLRFEGPILVCDGVASLEEGRDATRFFDELLRIEQATRRPVRLLLDLRGLPPSAFDDRGVIYRRRAEWAGRRVALVGGSPFHEFAVNFIIAASGIRGARYFVDEAEARTWLEEGARAP